MEAKLQQITHFIGHKSFWLFATLSSLATLHSYCTWKITNKASIFSDILSWGCILFMVWKRRNRIKFRGGFMSSIIGLLFILWMVVRDLSTQYYGSSLKVDVFHDLFPFVTFLGTLLIAVGIKRLIHYIPEILVALAVSITSPSIAVFNLIPRGSNIFTNLDAQFTAFMLHYIGFKVQRQGPIVSLPNGSIEVTTSCSTISLLTGIIPFITVILFVYPTNKIKKIYVCTGVILWSILFNAIRMSWLAFIVNQKDVIGFEYWHEGAGVNVLSNFNLLCVAGLTYQILNYSPKINQED